METKLPVDSLAVEWNTSEGKRGPEGNGSDYLEWKGTATHSLGFWVMARLETRKMTMFLSESIDVAPRPWQLPKQSAGTTYYHFPGNDTIWGAYHADIDSLLEGVEQGTGPWAGNYILGKEPTIKNAVLYVSWDLESGQPAARYKLVFGTCGLPAGDSIGVYDLNAVHCSNKTAIDAWKTTVLKHEEEHENSLNRCIKAVNRDGRLAAVEKIVGKTETLVADSAKDLWTDDLRKKLARARETAQGGKRSDAIWEWRRDRQWQKHRVEFGGHNGKDGCP